MGAGAESLARVVRDLISDLHSGEKVVRITTGVGGGKTISIETPPKVT